MIQKLTDEELMFMECFYNPQCATESLFSDGTPRNWNDGKKCIRLRLYQRPFLCKDSTLADDNLLSEAENFRKKIAVGTRFVICARKIGKTFVALTANILLKLIHYNDKEMTMASYDEKHVDKVLDTIREFLTAHDFFKCYKKGIKGSPEYKIDTKNGNTLFGINETVKGKNPGENWWSHHTFINFQDEVQAETEEAFLKKIDAVSDFGVLEVLCGIPLITKVSPLGKLLKEPQNKKHLIRLPQAVSSLFDDIAKNGRVRAYGGEESTGYKVNVSADLVEGASGAFDMEVVRSNYNKKRIIKKFEITKKNFDRFEQVLAIDEIKNADCIFIASDIGDAVATEIAVIALINGRYIPIYNITTYRLSLTKELPQLMMYIFKKVSANYISVDSTIMGKAVYEILAENLNESIKDEEGKIIKIIKRVYWCAFNENIVTGYEKDEKTGKILKDKNGNLIEKKEKCLPFAVSRLQQLFFDKKFEIPADDFKFDNQFSSYVSVISGDKLVYSSITDEDHYVQAFEVFAILEWYTNGLTKVLPRENKKKSIGTFLGM
jgi:hypothetical protein